ncbi:MAG: ATP-binding cassette, subfamily bacterial [Candidatus Dependentiae bacterium]|nr:ATP-binding cassette, subfamily bacterial [Candidatus Dependentiae bacterium]
MRVLSFINRIARPFRFYLSITIAYAVSHAASCVIYPYIIKLIINAAQEPDGPALIYYGILGIGIEWAIEIFCRIQDWAKLKYEPHLRNTISRTIMEEYIAQPHRFFQNNFAGSLAAKLGDSALAVPTMITTMINGMLVSACTTIFAIIMVFCVHPYLALALSIWALLFVSLSTFTIKQFKHLATDAAQAGSGVTAVLVDALTNMLGIRLFSTQQEEAHTIEAAQKIYLTANQRRRWFGLKLNTAQGLSFCLYQTFCTFFLIWLHMHHRITPGDFGFVLTVNLTLIDSLWKLGDLMRDFSDQWGMVENALETIYTPHEIQDIPHAQPLHASHGTITFDHVRFHYQGAEALFQDNSITIAAGQKVGLVGYSGSGKSTFVHLILRLYDVSNGRILIDGQNIAAVTQHSLRNAIAFVPQETSLFHRTVKENIAYGRLDATDEEIIAAAHQASAHDFIMQLPQQYETIVGERGTKLSGGQRQRIALARALLKNAPILILDEATSQLDTITEQEIQFSLEEWLTTQCEVKQRTTLVIAHRLSTLRMMDRILVFDNGIVVQDGTHEQLLAQDGLYRMLWQTQAGGQLQCA